MQGRRGLRAGRKRGRDGEGRGRTRRRRPGQSRRDAARHAHPDGAGLRGRIEGGQGRRAQVRGRLAVPGRASTGSTSTAATRTCAWCSHPSATSRPSAATRTISSSRAGASTCRSCAPMKAASRQRPRHTCDFDWDGAAAGRRGVRLRPPRQHGPPAHRGPARRAARHVHAVLADALLGAARPHDPVLEDRRRSRGASRSPT